MVQNILDIRTRFVQHVRLMPAFKLNFQYNTIVFVQTMEEEREEMVKLFPRNEEQTVYVLVQSLISIPCFFLFVP